MYVGWLVVCMLYVCILVVCMYVCMCTHEGSKKDDKLTRFNDDVCSHHQSTTAKT